jgi:hypothetical protein
MHILLELILLNFFTAVIRLSAFWLSITSIFVKYFSRKLEAYPCTRVLVFGFKRVGSRLASFY